jgi:hypothetical protein
MSGRVPNPRCISYSWAKRGLDSVSTSERVSTWEAADLESY